MVFVFPDKHAPVGWSTEPYLNSNWKMPLGRESADNRFHHDSPIPTKLALIDYLKSRAGIPK